MTQPPAKFYKVLAQRAECRGSPGTAYRHARTSSLLSHPLGFCWGCAAQLVQMMQCPDGGPQQAGSTPVLVLPPFGGSFRWSTNLYMASYMHASVELQLHEHTEAKSIVLRYAAKMANADVISFGSFAQGRYRCCLLMVLREQSAISWHHPAMLNVT